MAIHIKGFEIEAFRGVRNAKFADCDHVNLLVGNNNSGKTSVLEALFCSHRDFAPSSLLECLWCRGSFYRSNLISGVEWIFPHYHEESSNIELNIHRNQINKDIMLGIQEHVIDKYSINFSNISRIKQDDEKYELKYTKFPTILGAMNKTIENGFALFINKNGLYQKIEYWENSSIPKNYPEKNYPVIVMTPYGHRESSFASFYSEVLLYGLKDRFIKLIKLFDEYIEDVQIITSKDEISDVYIKHRETGLAPLSIFGDGLRRIFCIATLLTQCKDGIFLIDEVDAAIHYAAMKDSFIWLAKGAQDLNVQLFVTTHSLEAVDALIDSTDQLALYRLEQGGAVRRLAHDELRRFREEHGMEVR